MITNFRVFGKRSVSKTVKKNSISISAVKHTHTHLWQSRHDEHIEKECESCFIGRFMEHRKMGGSGSVSPVREEVYMEGK